jgi:flagellar basal-body rod modification protein FlgD
MEITPPSGQAALDRLNTPSRASGKGGLGSLGQADFLRLLTTQLQFQDPLEPVKNEAMLAQMAQFSALAANTETASTLAQISSQMDRLIAAQEAAAEAAAAAAAAAAQTPAP